MVQYTDELASSFSHSQNGILLFGMVGDDSSVERGCGKFRSQTTAWATDPYSSYFFALGLRVSDSCRRSSMLRETKTMSMQECSRQ